MSLIKVQGAREHNLKNISVDIPKDKFVVITGLSGSGKSSLAFDTIYAEGQRRYVESLSAYARQFLNMMQKPDVDHIDGLSPAISIEQKTTSKNPRSTVGTVTEIYDYLRLLFARVGVPYSPATGKPITAQTVSEMVDKVLSLPEKTKIYLLAPVIRGKKGEHKKEISIIAKRGFQRLQIDGAIYNIEDVPELSKNKTHNISIVVDRLTVRESMKQRLTEGFETALKLADGLAYVEVLDDNKKAKTNLVFSAKFACPESGFTIEAIEPRLFSFNSPFGACDECNGLGKVVEFSPELIVPDENLTVFQGAIKPWASGGFSGFYKSTLKQVIEYYGEDPAEPYKRLSRKVKDIIMYGSGDEKIPIQIHSESSGNIFRSNKPFKGIIPTLKERAKELDSNNNVGATTNSQKNRNSGSAIADSILRYQQEKKCNTCDGRRLNKMALSIRIDNMTITDVVDMSINKAHLWAESLKGKLSQKELAIADRILKEICDRLSFLKSVGLGYLNLSRMAGTLSGGEAQRIRLASQIGSGLTGVLYVLDEPSIGLHQRDNDKLLNTLKGLRDLGNSVIVVEHDEDAIRQADHIIDMGPRAGVHGGEIIAQGNVQDIINSDKSITGQYLRGEKKVIPENIIKRKKRRAGNGQYLVVKNARLNNLKNITVQFPLSTFTCVSGVSGGGKSSLVMATLYRYLAQVLNGAKETPGACDGVVGIQNINKIIHIDQSPIGKTPRSNPATYVGIFNYIREWFAELPEARARGYKPGRFSFNVKGGRCEACQGDGVTKIEMHFLPDVYVECDKCYGKRYNRETLEITYKDKSIADVLDMTVDEGVEFFGSMSTITDKLKTLQKVGLGYIHIGQRANTLSGGEAQRIKLSKELSKRSTGKAVYILDEPTTGLHFDDIRKLLEVLHSLVDQGNTVIVIEHNLDVIASADHVIDIGPEGGSLGGQIVATGTPEDIANSKQSYTGQYLARILK